jgi:hypothetical protein
MCRLTQFSEVGSGPVKALSCSRRGTAPAELGRAKGGDSTTQRGLWPVGGQQRRHLAQRSWPTHLQAQRHQLGAVGKGGGEVAIEHRAPQEDVRQLRLHSRLAQHRHLALHLQQQAAAVRAGRAPLRPSIQRSIQPASRASRQQGGVGEVGWCNGQGRRRLLLPAFVNSRLSVTSCVSSRRSRGMGPMTPGFEPSCNSGSSQ